MRKIILWLPTKTGSISVTATQFEDNWLTLTSAKENATTSVRVIKDPSPTELCESLKQFLE